MHEVLFAEPFYMGKYPITQEQWQAITGSNPSHFLGPRNPVEQVSWSACQAFVRGLNDKTGRIFALPSEAQWEYACRAGTNTEYQAGDTPSRLGEYAWYSSNSSGTTHPVGQKKPNDWGLYDMLGNVWEWCEDIWQPSYEAAPTDGSPWLESGDEGPVWKMFYGTWRMLRGSSWGGDAVECRCAFRARNAPGFEGDYNGCRVVLRPRGGVGS